jgi:oxygen-independent coproporphyrinogen III oxidase
MPAYVEALISEMKGYLPELRPLLSIFFGGGTPSYLTVSLLIKILEFIKQNFVITSATEITVEANPGTLGPLDLFLLRKAGFNRISIGLQAVQDRLLENIGRIHSWKDFLTVYHSAREAGFTNVGVDLIFGLPGQTLSNWRETLDQVISLQPEHISTYGLQLENETPLAEMVKNGMFQLPTEDETALMMQAAMDILPENGYEHYEISNYAKLGFRSVHNLRYWSGRDYLGFGAGAYSTNCGERWCNEKKPFRYIECLQNHQPVRVDREVINRRLAVFEAVMLGLRLRSGVNLQQFSNQFGINILEKAGTELETLIQQNLLVIRDGYLALSDQAVFISNYVISRLLYNF